MNEILQYWHWIVFGFALLALEIVLPTFMALWFGVAAVLTGIALYIAPTLSFTAQLLLWIGLSIAITVFWFNVIQPRAKDKTLAGLGREAMIGQIGLVLVEANAEHRGTLRLPAPILGNDEWPFRIHNSLNTAEFPTVGERVKVIEIAGNCLVVTKQ